MREIKFRALRRGKAWWYSSDEGIYFKDGYLYEFDDFDDINIGVAYQYTGLKDKNGVEIYEGDIVKWGHIKNREEFWHRVAFVELFPSLQFHILHYIDGKSLEKKEGDNYVFGFHNFIYKDTHNSLEVIGNICENPELLKA